MAKLILTDDAGASLEIPLAKEKVTIGRSAHNDIILRDPAVSGEHAKIVRLAKLALLEDLNSTNGIQVNGRLVKTHVLQDMDVIELGQQKLRYEAESAGPTDETCLASFLGAVPESQTDAAPSVACHFEKPAVIRFLNGPSAGRQVQLVKPLTTIGRQAGQVAVIVAGTEGYGITSVAGADFPSVNGARIGEGLHKLKNGDVIEIYGVNVGFCC